MSPATHIYGCGRFGDPGHNRGTTPRRASGFLALSVLVPAILAAGPALAHHGVAAVGFAGPEGPGTALETTSALPLPWLTAFGMLKGELVPFQRLRHAEPENKSLSSFNMAAVGFGALPWLSVYVFQPYNLKAQDGVGANAGFGDTNLMLSLGAKWDEGLRLVPEKESLDELADLHLGLWVSLTLPGGPTTSVDDRGEPFAPDMQTGFGEPSPAFGLALLKQISEDFTWLGEVSYQHFLTHWYPTTVYRFGGETRVNTAVARRAWASGRLRADLSGELCFLHLQRDQELGRDLEASGGAILYAGLGLRASWAGFSAALGARTAVAKSLNEQAQQQGSEGLELLRASLTLSYSIGVR